MFILVEIYRFFCSFMILCFDISFKRLEIAHLLKYWNVTFCDVFLIMWITLDNRKCLPTYIQEKGKFHSSYHICHVGLTCSQDHYLFDWTPCVASLSSSFLIHSIQETSTIEGVIMEIFSCLVDTFPVRASYFLLI